MLNEPAGGLPWRGIHHVALRTADLDATIQFYKEGLGMPVSDIAPSEEGRGRHCIVMVKPGDSETWGLHFFERPGQVQADAGAARQETLLHIAFRLPDEASAQLLRERLQHHKVEVTEIPELNSFVFWDNNGLMLETTWPAGPLTA